MITTSTLPNGLRIATDAIPHVETASIGVWVNVGSRQESVDLNGVSHFLEHMAFKGTTSRTAQQIAEEIESVGGYLNAYTSRESTAYHARVLKDDVPLAMDILADILQNSLFDQTEFERERTVILQEIGETEDTPDDIIFDHFQALCYPDQALGRAILGTPETVNSLTPKMVQSYMQRYYGAQQMVLTAAGHVQHDEIVKQAEKLFQDLTPGSSFTPESATYVGGKTARERDLEQSHIIIGYEGISQHSPEYHTASVLSSILGGGMSSRLFQEIREKRGLAYSIYTFSASYEDTGNFGIYANTSADQLDLLTPLIYEELQKAMTTLTEEEMRRAKAQYRASLLMSLENTSTRCEQLANQLLIFGRPIPLSETMEKINDVSLPSLHQLAQRIFSGKETQVVLGG